jgi:hypothetical protein
MLLQRNEKVHTSMDNVIVYELLSEASNSLPIQIIKSNGTDEAVMKV